ncbi:antibiotic biosynthesis monooxygenase [Paenibacillus nanensis]|uniref:Antibiotic biosynthesis monooxygenase n=1 Tax=Paenibacillus nanensis TaxID=393251 RepID=A0A3A1V0D9_9BACL|nr:putative quinol monooxygenase [Paenibacillus nanensis]RIX53965.1 antibiotic biosynthesis monooxygenase [Paenibacillus nanensis]
MSKFTMYGKMTAQPGKRDELVQILLQAAEGLTSNPGCELYIVNISEDNPDDIWVTELWRDAEAHADSLKDPGAMELIQKARPLIAGIEPVRLRPVGGKGL